VLDNTDSPGRGESIEYVLLEDLPSVAWIANLAGLELHVT
jgi:DNA primase